MKNIEQIERAVLRPGDLIVLSYPGALSEESMERMKEKMRYCVGDDYEILVLSDGLKISVLSKETAA
jgi:hypothetical protein